MAEYRTMKMSLFFILLLQFAGALSRALLLSFAVRDGDEVTLPCENVISNHHNCNTTTWLFSHSRMTAVELVTLGQIKEKAKSDRLSVTADCSLLIKKVTDEDVGHYTCRQFRRESGSQEGLDAVVHLSVFISWSSHRLIIVSVGLAALITAAVVVNIWIRAGKKKQRWMKTRCVEDDGAVNYENVRSSDEL